MEKNQCNHIGINGRCKGKATRMFIFSIGDATKVRVKLCKKCYLELKRYETKETI